MNAFGGADKAVSRTIIWGSGSRKCMTVAFHNLDEDKGTLIREFNSFNDQTRN